MRSPFRYFKTSPEIIRLAVMMYIRFPLSLCNFEDLLHERGIDICHETVRSTDIVVRLDLSSIPVGLDSNPQVIHVISMGYEVEKVGYQTHTLRQRDSGRIVAE